MTSLDELAALAPDLSWEALAPRELPTLRLPGLRLETLRRAIRRAARPLILVNDDTRVLLDGLGEVLGDIWSSATIDPRLLVATGTHKRSAGRMRDLLGGLPVELHDADDAEAHVELSRGVLLDRRVVDADLALVFGSVEPHYFGGWSGAHKTATVGVLARETIQRNHEHALSNEAQPLRLTGNPVYEDLARITGEVERGRRLLCVNHVLDGRGRPLGVGVGTWRGSLKRAVAVAARRFVAELSEPADVLVARVEGPLSRSLYQADKGIKNCEACVREGGALVLVADMADGLGPDRFVELLKAAPDEAAARARVEQEGYVLGDHKAVRLRALQARGVALHLVSARLPESALEGTGLPLHASLADALAATGVRAGRGVLVQDAGVCVPRVAS
ncbi:MAG TPA: hypothetical protein DEA08_26650 [Planctomycetes bacterium]|nr:hypothetical protein [Planctomycetota bacterium]